MYWLNLALAGLAKGAIYSLAGLGVVLTFKATGVFNFAHGAIAVLCAYVYWQLSGQDFDGGWGWPVGISAFIAIFVVGPLIGYLLEVAVFRPLQRSGASTIERLVATVGVFVLTTGVVVTIWTFRVRQVEPLFSRRPIRLTDELIIGFDQVMTIVVVAVICAAVWAMFRFTHLGTQIRAVVDRRELAELSAIDSNRVSAVAWMMGSTMSALTGVLLSAQIHDLNPYQLTLLVIETFSIAVVARLTSLPIAVGAGILLLGIGNAMLGDVRVTLYSGQGVIGETFNNLKPNLSVVILFAALLIYRRLDAVTEEGVAVRLVRPTGDAGRTFFRALGVLSAVALVVLPFTLDLAEFDYAHRMLAMMVIFASIVAVTGFAGQITLGQAGFAGLGGFASARVGNELDWPVIVSTLFGGGVAMVAGFLTGYPALRRRGLFLGLTTLAIGLLLAQFVFSSAQFAGGVNGLQVTRPSLFGTDLGSDKAFYFYELVIAALMLLLTRNLRSGRLGRALAAMRESEAGAQSVGIDLRRYKLFIFSVSAFMAGIGGALLTQQAQQFSFRQFLPIESLFWFAAVVVAGVGSIAGAVLAAFLFTMLDVITDTDGISQLVIGLAALVLGVLPGRSLTGLARHLAERAGASWERFQAEEQVRAERRARPPRYTPSEVAEAALQARERERVGQ